MQSILRPEKRNDGLCQHFWLAESCPCPSLVLALMPDNSDPPPVSLIPFKMLPHHWSSEKVSPSKSVYRSFKRNCLRLLQPQSPLASILTGFTARSYGNFSSGPGTLGWGSSVAGTPRTSKGEISLLIFISHRWLWGQPVLGLHSYQPVASLNQ